MRGLGEVGERLNEAMSRGGIPALLAGKEGWWREDGESL